MYSNDIFTGAQYIDRDIFKWPLDLVSTHWKSNGGGKIDTVLSFVCKINSERFLKNCILDLLQLTSGSKE